MIFNLIILIQRKANNIKVVKNQRKVKKVKRYEKII